MNQTELDSQPQQSQGVPGSQAAPGGHLSNVPNGTYAAADQIDLIDLMRFLWSKKLHIIGVAGFVLILVLAFLSARSAQYLSESKLALSLETADQGTYAMLGMSPELESADAVKHLAQYFSNRNLIIQAISTAVGSEFTSAWGAVEVETVRDGTVITVAATWDDAQKSASLVKEVTKQGINTVDALIANRLNERLEKAKARSAVAATQWQDASDAYAQLVEQHQVDTKQQKLAILISQRGEDKAALPRLLREKQRLELVLTSVNASLAKETHKTELKRSLAEDPQLTASLLAMNGKPLELDAMAGLALTVEQENSIYLDLKRRVIENTVALEEVKSKIAEIQKVLKQNDELVQQLKKEIESGNYAVSKARQLRDLAKEEHDAAKAEEWKIIAQKGRVQNPFLVIQEAYVPDSPENGLMHNVKMSLLAAIATGFLACMAFGFAGLFQQSARNQQQAA